MAIQDEKARQIVNVDPQPEVEAILHRAFKVLRGEEVVARPRLHDARAHGLERHRPAPPTAIALPRVFQDGIRENALDLKVEEVA